nr:MATE family efflux transporter [Metabacillus litoralis]
MIIFVISTFVFFFAESAIKLFMDDKEPLLFGTSYLQLIAFFYPFLGINFILNGIVRAAGAMFQVLLLNILSFWLLRYPLTYLCSQWFGESGIALGMGISFILSSVIAFGYYKLGKWDKINAINEASDH